MWHVLCGGIQLSKFKIVGGKSKNGLNSRSHSPDWLLYSQKDRGQQSSKIFSNFNHDSTRSPEWPLHSQSELAVRKQQIFRRST